LCDRGMSVSHLAVICKAGQLKPVFNEKAVSARKMYVSRFCLLKNNLVHRVVMRYFAAPFRACHRRRKGLHEVDCPQVNKQQLCPCTQEYNQCSMWCKNHQHARQSTSSSQWLSTQEQGAGAPKKNFLISSRYIPYCVKEGMA
jgi:hypothetical protein